LSLGIRFPNRLVVDAFTKMSEMSVSNRYASCHHQVHVDGGSLSVNAVE
jgi:hypothetical protein